MRLYSKEGEPGKLTDPTLPVSTFNWRPSMRSTTRSSSSKRTLLARCVSAVLELLCWTLILCVLQGERNYIMQVVCEATQSPSSDVQVAAFECLVKIMHLYYEWMKFYMERALFGVSIYLPSRFWCLQTRH